MVMKDMDLGPSQMAAENGLASASRMLFRDEEAVEFPRPGGGGGGDASDKPRSVAVPSFMIDGNNKVFAVGPGVGGNGRFFRAQGEVRQGCVYGASSRMGQGDVSGHQRWNAEGSNGTASEDGLEDEEENEEEDVDEGDGEVYGLVSTDNGVTKNHNNSSGSVQSSSEKSFHEKVHSQEHNSLFGSGRGDLTKDAHNARGSISKQQHQPCRTGQYENAIAITEPELYYARILEGEDVSTLAQKQTEGENGCSIVGRKVNTLCTDPVESLRMHLSDPMTGALMDDAMILSCGHSYGSAGMQYINRMKACYKCGHSVSGDSVRPNLALRSAVQAFRREEESQLSKASKRRRDRLEQDKFNCDVSLHTDISRGKGVQFPFVVSDRVIIKGNKRTPQRYVGRVAVVTTQCLNGWYVVKTLDNAESVKLQYRSLAKVTEDMSSNKVLSPNWL